VIRAAVFTKLQSKFDEIAEEMANELDPVVEQAAQMVAARAQNEVPDDTGRLRESIRPIKYDTCQYNVVADAKAPSKLGLPYGIMVEYGTEAGGKGGGNQAPNPFMSRAADEEAQQEFLDMVNEKLRNL
jgi:HK97 gp10 family phage protein